MNEPAIEEFVYIELSKKNKEQTMFTYTRRFAM